MSQPENVKNQGVILVYGDSQDHDMARILWSHLSGQDIKIDFPKSFQELDEKAPSALLIVIVVGDRGENSDLAQHFLKRPEVISEVMGIAANADTPARVRYLGQGFDTIFNLDMLTSLDFRNVLLVKTQKARARMTNKTQRDEYRRFRASLAASPDAFIVFDNQKRLFFISEHYKKVYAAFSDRLVRGLPVEEAFAMAAELHNLKPDNPVYHAAANFWLKLRGQIEFPLPDGRTWRCIATELPDNQGTIITTTDITDYLAQEKELRKKSAELATALEKEQEASALQKQFIGMVSHEFRTPLTVIDGHAQILQRRADEATPDMIRDRTKTIRSAVSRLVNMMESVLSSSLLKTGKMEPYPEDFDVAELLRELCNEQAELAKGHNILCDVDGVPAPFRQDRKMTILIVTNILANAVKFTLNNPDILLRARADGNNGVRIDIRDNGIGIPADEIGKVMDRYYRASTSAGIPGTGIGLSLCRDLTGLMGGTMNIESQPGQGTMVSIILPHQA